MKVVIGYTPGPWFYVQNLDGLMWAESRFICSDPDGQTAIAITTRGWDETEAKANARLIAAAPDMAKRIEELEGVIREYLDWGAMTGSDRDLFHDKFTTALEPNP